MIHICYGLHDKDGRYSKFVGTSIVSIFENTAADVTVHILHDNTLTLDNRDKFIYLAGRYSQKINFYNVEQIAAEEIEEIKNKLPTAVYSRYTVGAFYRLIVQNIIESIDKIIYLDGDTVVNLDIKGLWNINLADHPMAAVNESAMDLNFSKTKKTYFLIKLGMVKEENYFNSGVIAMNLKYFRNNDQILKIGYDLIAKNISRTFDQDILNYCFSDNYVKLPTHFNMFPISQKIYKRKIDNMIYHYAGGSLTFNISDIFNRLWFQYFSKTPWFNEDMIENLSDEILNMHNQHKLDLISLTKLMAGKCRAFFTESQNAEFVKNIFAVTPEEEFIITPPPYGSLDVLIKALNQSKGKKIFFILLNNYGAVHKILTDNNFVENIDFINGFMFLSENQGIPFNTHFIVRAM